MWHTRQRNSGTTHGQLIELSSCILRNSKTRGWVQPFVHNKDRHREKSLPYRRKGWAPWRITSRCFIAQRSSNSRNLCLIQANMLGTFRQWLGRCNGMGDGRGVRVGASRAPAVAGGPTGAGANRRTDSKGVTRGGGAGTEWSSKLRQGPAERRGVAGRQRGRRPPAPAVAAGPEGWYAELVPEG